ncbi:hypothetical protein YC2023_067062 [Brassica napus]
MGSLGIRGNKENFTFPWSSSKVENGNRFQRSSKNRLAECAGFSGRAKLLKRLAFRNRWNIVFVFEKREESLIINIGNIHPNMDRSTEFVKVVTSEILHWLYEEPKLNGVFKTQRK